MGTGSQKAHEAITITPASASDLTDASTEAATADAEPESPAHPHTEPDTPSDVEPDTPSDVDLERARVDPAGAATAGGEPAGDEILTPIPDEIVVGNMTGHPLIVGGDDLEDSQLTLVAYVDPDTGEAREVLYGWVTPDAENKIVDALALDTEKLIPVEVTKELDGRLPLDETNNLYEQLQVVAKSVNHHLKAGDGIPDHTRDNLDKLHAQLSSLHESATDDEKQMLASYLAVVDEIAPKMLAGYDEPYTQGGKVGYVSPHTVQQTVTVTEMVPAPAEEPPEGLLGATIRETTRIKPTLTSDGVGSWDGMSRYDEAVGVEYRVDLGDGYEAVYRPHVTQPGHGSAVVGQRGFLEIIAPVGAGHGAEMVDRLGQLNLVNRPMTAAEAEWTYLQRNVWAQRLDTHPDVASAINAAKTLDDTFAEVIFAERAHQAVGMNNAELGRFAKAIQLEAEARALPEKSRLVRDAVATHLGLANGDTLAASPGYDPKPRRSAGWYVWDRFDVTADPDAVSAQFGNRVLYHHVTGNNIADMFRNSGALVATERRRVMGIQPGLGMSEHADMTSGGSRAVDLRIGNTPPSAGTHLVWTDPTKLMRRSDWYAYDGDFFAASTNEGKWSTNSQTRDPAKVAKFKKSNNEILFRNGIDLCGPEGPDQIRCSSPATRKQLLKVLAAKQITSIGGRPVEDVVTE